MYNNREPLLQSGKIIGINELSYISLIQTLRGYKLPFPEKEFNDILSLLDQYNQEHKQISILNRSSQVIRSEGKDLEQKLANWSLGYYKTHGGISLMQLREIKNQISRARKEAWIRLIQYSLGEVKSKQPFSFLVTRESGKKRREIRKKTINLISELKDYNFDVISKISAFLDELSEYEEEATEIANRQVIWKVIAPTVGISFTGLGVISASIGPLYEEWWRNIAVLLGFILVGTAVGTFIIFGITNRQIQKQTLRICKENKPLIFLFGLVILGGILNFYIADNMEEFLEVLASGLLFIMLLILIFQILWKLGLHISIEIEQPESDYSFDLDKIKSDIQSF